MSRLPPSRWARILIWTGAAGAWGTVFATSVLEPARPPADQAEAPAVVPAAIKPAMPAAPKGGLMILRYRQEPEPLPETRVITIQQTAPVPPPAPAPAPAPVSPPNPTSSGS